jgi:hypothetical protein
MEGGRTEGRREDEGREVRRKVGARRWEREEVRRRRGREGVSG